MINNSIILPSQPEIIKEDNFSGVYEIEGLYPGYGHTLGNSLRRIILSSLSGVAVVSVKIEGVNHEFSVIEGVKEDVVTILLNLRQIRLKMTSDGPQTLTVHKKGVGALKSGDLSNSNGEVEVIDPDQVIATLTDKNSEIKMEVTVKRGLGFVAKDQLKQEKVDIGTIALDAVFTPIRRVSYEVENMRIGDRTDFNKLKISIETDSTISPHDALQDSIKTMIDQLKAIVGFKEDELSNLDEIEAEKEMAGTDDKEQATEEEDDILKTRVESLDLSTRTQKALSLNNIRTVGGLVRKKAKDLLELDGLGQKGLEEIESVLDKFGLELKEQ